MAIGITSESEGGQTVVGAGAFLEGTLELASDMRVDGALRGARLQTPGVLTVGEQGRVDAKDVQVGEATICGHLSGRLSARRCVRIVSGGRFSGKLITPKLILEEGAVLEQADVE